MKRKQRIDVDWALCRLTDEGFRPEPLNHYQIRLFRRKEMWDWYHTTGSLVRTRGGFPERVGTVFEVDKLIRFINNK